MRIYSSGGPPEEVEVPPTKPRVGLLRDAYALEHGKPWACSYAGLIARGTTPEAAYKALADHFETMTRERRNYASYGPAAYA